VKATTIGVELNEVFSKYYGKRRRKKRGENNTIILYTELKVNFVLSFFVRKLLFYKNKIKIIEKTHHEK
jgi:hypothetical protein